MSPFVVFLLRRLVAIPVTFVVITAALYGIVMLAPAEERATLYWPPRSPPYMHPTAVQNLMERLVEEHGLNDPYPVQYGRWLWRLLQGDWGWSPVLNGPVFEALKSRTPATLELTFFALLAILPIGLASGVLAGWREDSAGDHRFRALAFAGTSIPPFILALFLLSIFYVGLGWFPPGRTSISELRLVTVTTFTHYTGFLTLDGLLNKRLDVTLDALRHLVLPVTALGLAHWATLGRITRASMIEVKDQEYIVAARARGLRNRSIVWRHALRNALLPALTSTGLTVASLITGVYVIEVLFNLHGVSELLVSSMGAIPDAALALGFATYTILLVLPVMLTLDLAKAVLDPRLRHGVIER
jgi:peptide/nickel transport system permease protein